MMKGTLVLSPTMGSSWWREHEAQIDVKSHIGGHHDEGNIGIKSHIGGPHDEGNIGGHHYEGNISWSVLQCEFLNEVLC